MDCYIWGAGGHARVVCSIIDTSERNLNVIGFVDKFVKDQNEVIFGRPVIHPDLISSKGVVQIGAIIGVGDNAIRQKKYDEMIEFGFIPVKAIHKNAIISETSQMGNGIVIASGAIISTLCQVGSNTIINTGAIIDHETVIGDHCHIAPGVNIAGRVEIQNNSFIGIGSTIKEYVNIGRNVTVGAGSVIL